MGYEINFKYFKKKAEGFGYDTEGEPETMNVSVGKEWDDVNLDEVAKAVFGQMAKRNVLIVDAEVFEYTKKKVSFKIKDDAILIKNKKFSYDITGAIKSETEQEYPSNQVFALPAEPIIGQNGNALQPHEIMSQIQPMPVARPVQDFSHLTPEVQAELRQSQLMQQQQQPRPSMPSERMRRVDENGNAIQPGRPLRYEIYDPHPDIARVAASKKLPFTIGRRYPIYEEKADRRGVFFGMIYITEDDRGNRCGLNDKHFIPQQNLTNDFGSEARPNHIARVAVEENQVVSNGQIVKLPDIFTLGNSRRR